MASPYLTLLKQLLESVDGALAAGFADYEGETVELAGSLEDYPHRLHLAYQGIVLHKLQQAHNASAETPSRISLTCQKRSVVIQPLKSGYYLVLTLARGASLHRAEWHLERTAQELNPDL